VAADIIIYGVIAAGLALWLKNVLGTRHGEERQRPNPYNAKEKTDKTFGNTQKIRESSNEDEITALFDSPKNNLSFSNDEAKAGLRDIAKVDKDFDIEKFMNSSQDAFVFIVESFAEGDREALEGLLAKNVYKAFDQAITMREQEGQKMQTEIHAFRNVEVMEAKIKGKKAYITVLFNVDETSVTYDKQDKCISGDPDRITEMRDLWVFSREMNTRDPRWIVQETRDVDGDNDIIPNA